MFPLSYRKIRDSDIYLMVLTTFLFALTYLLYGYHFGWIDDVLQSNYFRGIPLAEPISHFYTVHLGLSKLYRNLYQAFPEFGWYGFIMGIMLWMATLNFFQYVRFLLLKLFQPGVVWLSLILILLYFLCWVENIYLLNFSRVSLLLMGTSVLHLDRLLNESNRNELRPLSLGYYSLGALLGWLTRPELMLILIPLLPFFAFRTQNHWRRPLIFFGWLSLLLLLGKIIERHEIDPDSRKVVHTVGHLLNIADAHHLHQNTYLDWYQKDLKFRLSFLYFMPDEDFFNSDTLNRWGPPPGLSPENFSHRLGHLKQEYERARYLYPSDYLPELNWFFKAAFIFCLHFALIILWCIGAPSGKNKWKQALSMGLLFAAFYGSVFMITLLSKMEDRVLFPAMLLFSLMLVRLWLGNEQDSMQHRNFSKRISYGLLVLFIALLPARLGAYAHVSKAKKAELKVKKQIQQEIDERFNGKLIFYDLWTMTLLHQSPLEVVQPGKNNQHLCYGEYWSNQIPSHRAFLKNWCGNASFIPFYRCLYQRRADVVFVASGTARTEQLPLLAKEVYGESLNFKPIEQDAVLYRLKYSFIPYTMHFGYYVFDNSFEDRPKTEPHAHP